MQHRLIRLIAHRAQHPRLMNRSIGQQRQRVIGVGGKHHLVKQLPLRAHSPHFGPRTHTPHPGNRRAQPQVNPFAHHRRLQPPDIFDGPALHRIPLMLPGGRQQRVVREELHHRLRRKVQNPDRRRGPDRPGNRQQVIIPKPIAGPQALQQPANRQIRRIGQGQPVFVEMQDIADHPQIARAGDIGPLRKHRVQRLQPVFQPATVDRRPPSHAAFGNRHLQLVEQRAQMRIVYPIEHDKPGVYRLIAPLARHHRARMAAKPTLGLKQHHRMIARQQMCRSHPRYPPADHGNPSCGWAKSFKWHKFVLWS